MRLLSGLRAWTVQRLSALLLTPLVLWMGGRLLYAPPVDHAQWRALLADPAANVAVAGLFAALIAHAWVGLRDVVLDYVHARVLRAALLGAVAVGLAATGTVAALALVVAQAR
ncbi:MAG: succinate dehydrogenase, hydrophobic membrane anchor protein [Burkholderiales bacterium]|jgi:succinate dehydrogenase / fumarate reductase membrane anchor subunit|nr:succinate dehydrogenase, hydrophobic membrane anchor protein [Burkholderiales bacterium]